MCMHAERLQCFVWSSSWDRKALTLTICGQYSGTKLRLVSVCTYTSNQNNRIELQFSYARSQAPELLKTEENACLHWYQGLPPTEPTYSGYLLAIEVTDIPFIYYMKGILLCIYGNHSGIHFSFHACSHLQIVSYRPYMYASSVGKVFPVHMHWHNCC